MRLYNILKKLRLDRILGPGWPDHARFLIQAPVLTGMTREIPMTGKCLNAGCGEGLYLPFLESLPGVGQIANMDVTLPRRTVASRGHLVSAGSLTHIPFEMDTFECCLCTEVIEHVQDDNLAVSELARVLKPGGLLLLSVPQIPAPADPSHVREGYTFETMTRLLSDNGFSVLKRSDCMHAFARIMMWLWRHPFIVFGQPQNTYLPNGLLVLLSLADRYLPLGKPWDLVILAKKEG
jgi:SAM-dependent methyltransferase